MKFFNFKKSAERLRVYLAGPDVFLPNPIGVGKIKKDKLAQVGYEGLYPMDPSIENFQPNPETAYKIALGNEGLMDSAQIILVNMTPWHGPSMDVGTAFEAGYMRGLSKFKPGEVLIVGYYEGPFEHDFTKRVADIYYKGEVTQNADGSVTDKNGNSLEKFGLTENLMIPGAIKQTGGEIFMSFDEAVANLDRLCALKQKAAEQVHVAEQAAVAVPN